jgi:hypothetical protein
MSYLLNSSLSRNIEPDYEIGKSIPLQGSGKPGEVLATVAAIDTRLKSSNRDWHDLAEVAVLQEDIDAAVFASLRRILEGNNPAENKLQVFRLGVLTAVRNIERLIQQYQADLRQFADDTGLITTFGPTMVEEVIRTGFGGGK